jgi:hypothetical protein
VPVSLVVPGGETAPRIGLVDTGAENVLAAGWLADLAEVSVPRNADTALIGIGGHTAEVPFVEVELRLYPPDAAEEFISWRCDVGFVPGWQAPFDIVLGQVGFLDRFTATFHREQPCSPSRTGLRSTLGSPLRRDGGAPSPRQRVPARL